MNKIRKIMRSLFLKARERTPFFEVGGFKVAGRLFALTTVIGVAVTVGAFIALSIAVPGKSYAQLQPGQEDPCPAPAFSDSGAPDDLARVQSDIDRFTLCVERARLLKSLNDLALENQESILGGSAGINPGMTLGASGNNRKDKAGTLPDFDKDRLLEKPEPRPQPADSFSRSGTVQQDEKWIVLSVFGTSGRLRARLSKGSEIVSQAVAGDMLPDGGRVKSISVDRVVIVDEQGRDISLNWQGYN